jgi:two-component system, chemotaxis family, protein-glutamate methylesterase/glutaminase
LVATGGKVELSHGPRIGGHRPSIDMAMQSAAQVFGRHTTGVLLTGMGADGALGLEEIHQRRGRTFAQTSATCVVDSMPRQAREKGVVQRSGAPTDLANWLMEI